MSCTQLLRLYTATVTQVTPARWSYASDAAIPLQRYAADIDTLSTLPVAREGMEHCGCRSQMGRNEGAKGCGHNEAGET